VGDGHPSVFMVISHDRDRPSFWDHSIGGSDVGTGSAAYWADEVIIKGGYKLVTSIEDLWNFNKQINAELIFSVNYSSTSRLNGNAVNGEGNQLHQFFLATYASQRGMKEDLANGRALGRLRPTGYLLDVFDRKVDSRF